MAAAVPGTYRIGARRRAGGGRAHPAEPGPLSARAAGRRAPRRAGSHHPPRRDRAARAGRRAGAAGGPRPRLRRAHSGVEPSVGGIAGQWFSCHRVRPARARAVHAGRRRCRLRTDGRRRRRGPAALRRARRGARRALHGRFRQHPRSAGRIRRRRWSRCSSSSSTGTSTSTGRCCRSCGPSRARTALRGWPRSGCRPRSWSAPPTAPRRQPIRAASPRGYPARGWCRCPTRGTC